MGARGIFVCIYVIVSLAITGCTVTVQGNPERVPPSYRDVVPGLRAKGGPNGLISGVPIAPRTVEGTTDSESESQKNTDDLVIAALEDIESFWREKLPIYFKNSTPFEPVKTLYSYDSNDIFGNACGFPTYEFPNAMYCMKVDSIAWDRGLLVPLMNAQFPPIAVIVIMAHEYGHRIQHLAKIASPNDSTIVLEQQADCFAGFFIRHLVQKGTKHFQLNSANGLNTILAAMLAVRDSTTLAHDIDYKNREHGSGFDRISAFQQGFYSGANACAKINKNEIDNRRNGLPIVPDLNLNQNGIPITEKNIKELIVPSLTYFYGQFMKPLPTVTYNGVDKDCAKRKKELTEKFPIPALYCEKTNTISLDISTLAEIGTPTMEGNLPLKFSGDASAFGIISSRYALAYLQKLGKPLTGLGVGLFSACLSGAWMRSIVGEDYPTANTHMTVMLTPGDLDKVTSELLQHGYIAEDINGTAAPSALTRFNAFRVGVIGPKEACNQEYLLQ